MNLEASLTMSRYNAQAVTPVKRDVFGFDRPLYSWTDRESGKAGSMNGFDLKCRPLVLIFTLMTIMTWNLTARAGEGDSPSNPGDPEFMSVDFGKTLVKDQSEDRFASVAYSELPANIQSQSKNHVAIRLQPDALPQKTADVRVRVFAATNEQEDDLIEYTWSFLGRHLRLVETINAMKLQVDLLELDENESDGPQGTTRLQKVRDFLPQVIKMQGKGLDQESYEITVHWPESLTDGQSFSSNPDKQILRIYYWHERIDAFVHGDVLSVLLYKKVPQLGGFQDGASWFPGDFREMIRQRAVAPKH